MQESSPVLEQQKILAESTDAELETFRKEAVINYRDYINAMLMFQDKAGYLDTSDGFYYEIDDDDTLVLVAIKNPKETNELFDGKAIISIAERIAPKALKGLHCKSIRLPFCKKIGKEAFYESTITQIDAPRVVEVEESAFRLCKNLLAVNLSSCEKLPSYVFSSCTSLKIAFLDNCKSLDTAAFSRCFSLCQLDLPNCTDISCFAFDNCPNLDKLNLNKDICKLTNPLYGLKPSVFDKYMCKGGKCKV